METWAARCTSYKPTPACGGALKRSNPDQCTNFRQGRTPHMSAVSKCAFNAALMCDGGKSFRPEATGAEFLKRLSRNSLGTCASEAQVHRDTNCSWKKGFCHNYERTEASAKVCALRRDVASRAVASDSDRGGDENEGLSEVRIILVEPRGALNVGMVARSMANFGLRHLVLVNPQGEAADYQGEEACRMACHAVSILEEATTAPTLAAALAGVTRAVATTARQRAPPAPPLEILKSRTVGGGLDWLLENDAGCSAMIFGREDSGLTNDELSFAQRTLMIPSSPAYSSLNLSHAVAVVCYELSQQARSHRAPERVPRVPDDVSTSSVLDDDVSESRARSATGPQHLHEESGMFTPDFKNGPGLEPEPSLGVQDLADKSTSTLAGESGFADPPEASTIEEREKLYRQESQSGQSEENAWEERGDSEADFLQSRQLEREGLVESPDGLGRPGWRKTRRLDRALRRTDVADGADVEGALKQAEDLLTKMGFLKGDTRNAKVPKLRQLLVRASPTNSEVALLRAIIRRMDWHVTKAQENDHQ